MSPRALTATARLALTVSTALALVGCGASAGSGASSGTVAGPGTSATGGVAPSQPASQPGGPATADPGAGGSDGGGPIGGDIGDRSKGSIQGQVTGGVTAAIDLPFGAAAARFEVDGPDTAYLPYTDEKDGTLFLTISAGQLLVQYAGPDQVSLANGATPCELHLDRLDTGGAKGSFTCKGMLLIKGETMGSADLTGTFEAHP